MRLLFVEDEPDLREVLKKQLQGSGYSVDACGEGAEALVIYSLQPMMPSF